MMEAHDDYEAPLKEFEGVIKQIARKTVPNDPEDLEQELRIVLWQLPPDQTRGWYIERLKSRAVDYVRKKGALWGEDDRELNVSFDVLEDMGFQFDTNRKVYAPVKEMG